MSSLPLIALLSLTIVLSFTATCIVVEIIEPIEVKFPLTIAREVF